MRNSWKTFLALGALLWSVAMLADATVAPPVEEFPARRWTGERWKVLTPANSRLVAYYKELGDTPTDTLSYLYRVVCSFNSYPASLWYFDPPVTGTYWVWDQMCTPDSLIIGMSARGELGPDMGAGGSGDIASVGIWTGPLAPRLLGMNGDSLTGNPRLYFKTTDADSRWVNEGQPDGITNAMMAAASVSPSDLNATNGLTNGYLTSYNSATGKFTWVAPTSGGSVTGVTVNANSTSYLSIPTPTPAPVVEFLPAGLDGRFFNITGEAASISTEGTLGGKGGLIAGGGTGVSGFPGYIHLSTGVANTYVSLYGPNGATSSYSITLPTAVPSGDGKVPMTYGTTAGGTGLTWADIEGGGTVTLVSGGTGITITGTPDVLPVVSLNTTYTDGRYFNIPTESDTSVTASGSLYAYRICAANNVRAGNPSAGGHFTLHGASPYRGTEIWPAMAADQSGTVTFRLPYNNGIAGEIHTRMVGSNNESAWSSIINVAGSITSAAVVSSRGLSIASTLNPTIANQFYTSGSQTATRSYVLPTDWPPESGRPLIGSNTGVLSWGAAFKGKVPPADTVAWGWGRGPSYASFLKYYVDQEYVYGDSTYVAENEDHSFLGVDTTLIAARDWVEAYVADSIPNLMVDSVWAEYASITDIYSINGYTGGGATLDSFAETTGHWWVDADSSWSDRGGWYTNRFRVGDGESTDRLTVGGSLAVTGSATTGSIAATGQVTATTKMTAADSVNARRAVRSGTATTAGSLVLFDGSNNALNVTAPAMATDEALTLFKWARADTFLCSITRPAAARDAYKYFPGVKDGDLIILSASGLATGAHPTVVVGYLVEGSSDTLNVNWASGNDNKILHILVIRP